MQSHATRPEEVGSVEVIFNDEQTARDYAISRSADHRVLAVSVTEFVIGELGSRHPVAWYRDGHLQAQRSIPARLALSRRAVVRGESPIPD